MNTIYLSHSFKLIVLCMSILMGCWCYLIAKKKGRDASFAAFMGFLFGIFAVLVYSMFRERKNDKIEIRHGDL